MDKILKKHNYLFHHVIYLIHELLTSDFVGISPCYSLTDEDGDDVVISSDDEVMVALSQMMSTEIIKLYIYCKESEPEEKEPVCEVSFTPFLETSAGKDSF